MISAWVALQLLQNVAAPVGQVNSKNTRSKRWGLHGAAPGGIRHSEKRVESVEMCRIVSNWNRLDGALFLERNSAYPCTQ
jgi:hypothetical protein